MVSLFYAEQLILQNFSSLSSQALAFWEASRCGRRETVLGIVCPPLHEKE